MHIISKPLYLKMCACNGLTEVVPLLVFFW